MSDTAKDSEERPSNKHVIRNVQIVQILFAREDSRWQGRLLGLGDDGVVYMDECGEWEPLMLHPRIERRGEL